MPRQIERADAGRLRAWRPGTLVVLPAATAHSRPDEPDGDPAVPRWFCRASIRVALEGRKDPDARAKRLQLALLVAEHVWGDVEFAAAARRELA